MLGFRIEDLGFHTQGEFYPGGANTRNFRPGSRPKTAPGSETLIPKQRFRRGPEGGQKRPRRSPESLLRGPEEAQRTRALRLRVCLLPTVDTPFQNWPPWSF